MGRTGKQLGRIALAAHLAWIALLLGSFIWGAATGSGLYGLLMRWQIERSDAYSDLPAILLHLALAAPSIWILFGHLEARGRAAARTPEQERRIFQRAAWTLFGLAAALLATGIYCFTMVPPSRGYIEPVEITATQLLRGEYPADAPVRLWAQPVAQADYAFREIRGRFGSRETGWRGLKALDDLPNPMTPLPPASGPVAVFSEATSGTRSAPEELAEVISVSGRVVKNGLPELARQRLTEAGVAIAEPHYVLRHDGEESGGWLTGGLLSLFGAVIAALFGTMLLLRGIGVIHAPRR